MDKSQFPVISGEQFQIFKASQDKGGLWHVHARLGNVLRNVEVRGTAEHVLQVMDALSNLPEKVASLRDRARFMVENGQVLGSGIMAATKKVHPFHLHLFRLNACA